MPLQMRVFGFLVVRNAVDLVRVCLLHHLSLGLERILVIDNGSTDGTTEVLRRLARRHPISYAVDPGPFLQDELSTELAREAARAGADWVLPIDADEFLTVDEPLLDVLGRVRTDGVLVEVVNFVQRSNRSRRSPRALLTMTMRAAQPVDAAEAISLGRAGRISIVEADWPRKLITRASTGVELSNGNHAAGGADRLELTDRMRILHAPLRARSALSLLAEHGRRIAEVRSNPSEGWQHRRVLEAAEQGRLDQEWRANSHVQGHLHRDGVRVPLVQDERLRRAVAPLVRSPARQALARAAGRAW